jgi:hypothetical protein
MTTFDLLRWLQDSAIGLFIRKSDHLVGAAIQVFHIVGLILLLTVVLLVTLRLFGCGLRRQSLLEITRATTPLFWIGYGLIVSSGILMFIGNAVIYFANPAFQYKMALFMAASLIQVGLFSKVLTTKIFPYGFIKGAALLSLTLWLAVGLAGRAIGFV